MENSRESYFAVLRETSCAVLPSVLAALDELRSGSAELFAAAYPPLLDRFTEGPLLQKAALFRLAFESAGGKRWERFVSTAAAIEMLNLATYLENLGLDGKGHARSLAQRCDQFLAATTCREATNRLVAGGLAEPALALEVLRLLSRAYSEIHYGQHQDIHAAATEAFLKDLDLGAFEERYERRCSALSGVFNAIISEIGARLAGANDPTVAWLRAFGAHFGTALQIVNDLADCTPSHWEDRLEKDYQGNFSDLRNGRLTLGPAHCLFVAEPASAVRERLGRPDMDPELKDRIASVMWETGSVGHVRRRAERHFRAAKRHLRPIGQGSATQSLGVLASILVCNKYWTAWRLRFGTRSTT